LFAIGTGAELSVVTEDAVSEETVCEAGAFAGTVLAETGLTGAVLATGRAAGADDAAGAGSTGAVAAGAASTGVVEMTGAGVVLVMVGSADASVPCGEVEGRTTTGFGAGAVLVVVVLGASMTGATSCANAGVDPSARAAAIAAGAQSERLRACVMVMKHMRSPTSFPWVAKSGRNEARVAMKRC